MKTEFAENSKRETPEVHSLAVKVDREAVRSLSIAMKKAGFGMKQRNQNHMAADAKLRVHGKSTKERSEKEFSAREQPLKQPLNQIICARNFY
jgi:hypothetical protein